MGLLRTAFGVGSDFAQENKLIPKLSPNLIMLMHLFFFELGVKDE
jgi:hypothetical protein